MNCFVTISIFGFITATSLGLPPFQGGGGGVSILPTRQHCEQDFECTNPGKSRCIYGICGPGLGEPCEDSIIFSRNRILCAVENSQCKDGTCQCYPGLYASDDKTQCERKRLNLGEACTHDLECGTAYSFCDDGTEGNRVCKCYQNFIQTEDGNCHPNASDYHCSNGKPYQVDGVVQMCLKDEPEDCPVDYFCCTFPQSQMLKGGGHCCPRAPCPVGPHHPTATCDSRRKKDTGMQGFPNVVDGNGNPVVDNGFDEEDRPYPMLIPQGDCPMDTHMCWSGGQPFFGHARDEVSCCAKPCKIGDISINGRCLPLASDGQECEFNQQCLTPRKGACVLTKEGKKICDCPPGMINYNFNIPGMYRGCCRVPTCPNLSFGVSTELPQPKVDENGDFVTCPQGDNTACGDGFYCREGACCPLPAGDQVPCSPDEVQVGNSICYSNIMSLNCRGGYKPPMPPMPASMPVPWPSRPGPMCSGNPGHCCISKRDVCPRGESVPVTGSTTCNTTTPSVARDSVQSDGGCDPGYRCVTQPRMDGHGVGIPVQTGFCCKNHCPFMYEEMGESCSDGLMCQGMAGASNAFCRRWDFAIPGLCCVPRASPLPNLGILEGKKK